MNESFTTEQKEYLNGFMAGVVQRRSLFLGTTSQGQFTNDPAESIDEEETLYGIPLDELNKEEKIKHEKNGLDIWETIVANADINEFPEPPDVFRYKFFGLFHVKPAQDSFMLRCRIPGGELTARQMAGLAEIAENWGGGYTDITTRANLQVREIMPKNTLDTLIQLEEIGLTSKGSGADNIRNITATPTTGIDRREFIDVMPLAKKMHHYILNNRDLYGLPRKFNISFDSGGAISVCADTNDIGFYACRYEGHVYFRMHLCGITGHRQFASDTGYLLKAEECIPVAAAIIRVFVAHGDRTNRKKARLKYLVDKWGMETFLENIEKEVTFPIEKVPIEKCELAPPRDQHGHLGIHNQQQQMLNYVGIRVPVGRLTVEQMRKVAELAETYGSGKIRLTVWQNLLIPDIPDSAISTFLTHLRNAGLTTEASHLEGGIIACTGNKGCKFAAADTKGHALALGEHLGSRFDLEDPINIHLTGCHHSCAQHYIGDIGLQAAPVKVNGETAEGYQIVLGGGVDENQAIAKEIYSPMPYTEIPGVLEDVIQTYLDVRKKKESFGNFTRRHTADELKSIFTLEHAPA